MSTTWLKRDIPDERLDEMYGGEDYYWYLRSPEFQDCFLKPMGAIVKGLGGPVLDVGCGEGWLWPYISPERYLGIDGSTKAIQTAKSTFEQKTCSPPIPDWKVARIEEPKNPWGLKFNVAVFGGLLDVLVKPEYYLDFIEAYRKEYAFKYFMIYDLVRLDTEAIESQYTLMTTFTGTANVHRIPTVKRTRKVLVFVCQ